MERCRIAVICAGFAGLVTLKNALEGFDATGFEGRDTIGDIWKYTDAGYYSVLETTVSNKSRYKNAYTDFPHPHGTTEFPTTQEVQTYLELYAKHFNLSTTYSSPEEGTSHFPQLPERKVEGALPGRD